MVQLECLGPPSTQCVFAWIERPNHMAATIALAELGVGRKFPPKVTLPFDVQAMAELLETVQARECAIIQLLSGTSTAQLDASVRETLLTAVVVAAKQ